MSRPLAPFSLLGDLGEPPSATAPHGPSLVAAANRTLAVPLPVRTFTSDSDSGTADAPSSGPARPSALAGRCGGDADILPVIPAREGAMCQVDSPAEAR